MFDNEKEFSHKGISICRGDFESLPLPMKAHLFTDKQMQELVTDIWANMSSTQEDIEYRNNHLGEMDRIVEKVEEDFWEVAENMAITHGMEYYED